MSDKDKKKDKDKPEIPEDKSTPSILDEGLVKWAERCFQGDEQANEFIVTQLLGRTGKAEGNCLRRRPVGHLKAEGGVKRELLIAVCNELIEEMQDEADQMRQPRRFVVVARSPVKGAEFARKTIECLPRSGIVKIDGRSSTRDGDDDDIDPLGGDIIRKRAEVVLQDGRFYAELVAQVLGGSLKLEIDRNQEKDRMIKELFDANMALARQNNEALNNKVERDMILAEHELKLTVKRKGVALIAGLLPDFLKKVTGGAVNVPGGRTAESMAIEAVMDEKAGGLSSEEKHKIFGDWTDAGERLAPGILDEKQVRILVDILNDKAPVDDLDRLITDGSDDQLTTTQYANIMAALGGDIDKLAPVLKILKDRKAAIDKRAAASSTHAVKES